ncbi:hypothetical protein ACGFX4_07860 [Kitasatospora sp. NPDC048365]|uniref:hypothetical protein n=1 Tax=Kitasatospora sp. NPDC048365 TaxID=3364050 RepID=UPI0037117FE1
MNDYGQAPVTDLGIARAQIDALLDGTLAAITPAVEWADGPYVASEHDDPFTKEPDGTARLEKRRYLLTRFAAARYGALLGVVEREWQGRGWRITSMDPDPVLPDVRAEAPGGSTVELRVGHLGNVTLVARVPRVPAVGTSYPFGGDSTVPLRPDGTIDTVPRFDDPFWSA